jgi:Tfp pilus assembly protein PilP
MTAEKPVHPKARAVAERRSRVRPKHEIVKVAEPAVAKQAALAKVAAALPVPATFKAIGYVEKPEGQVEAIIMQDNEVQVVHLGDLVGGRYRVTKISPDVVAAVDETQTQSPMAKANDTKPGEPLSPTVNASSVVSSPAPPENPEPLPDTAESASPATPDPGPVTSAPSTASTAPSPTRSNPMDSPSVAAQSTEEPESLGMVQKANGQVDTVIADGDTVRLEPDNQTNAMAQVARSSSIPEATAEVGVPSSFMQDPAFPVQAPASAAINESLTDVAKPISMKPLGFVEKADGEFAAILSQDDEIYIVRQGDRFGGHYRALSVSADAVEALQEPPTWPGPSPSTTTPEASAEQRPTLGTARTTLVTGNRQLSHAKETGILPASSHRPANDVKMSQLGDTKLGQADHSTFIFQTLGYVQSHDGALQAVVADGPQVYLVKPGETFADRYLATSVDRLLVLAVRIPPKHRRQNNFSAQTDSHGKPASNQLDGRLDYLSSRWVTAQAFHEFDASGAPRLTGLDPNLIKLSQTGFDLQPHLFLADEPQTGF